MRNVKRWLALAMLGLALAFGGCGLAGEGEDDVEQEQVLPGEGGEDNEGDEGD